ncbi:MAG: hypothetical protein ACI9O0_000531 [Paracoccaceae bacterium]|jgi:hypothetical protein
MATFGVCEGFSTNLILKRMTEGLFHSALDIALVLITSRLVLSGLQQAVHR